MSLRMTLEQVEAHQHRLKKLVEAHQRRIGRAPAIALPPPAKRVAKESQLEVLFAQQISALGLPEPVRQFKGAVPGRKYRIDFCWPEHRICLEVQGMAHRIRERFLADCEKVSLLTLAGWRVLLASGDDVRSGRAATWLTALVSIVARETTDTRTP